MGHNLGNNYWLSCNSLVLPNTEFTVTGDNCVRPAPPAPPPHIQMILTTSRDSCTSLGQLCSHNRDCSKRRLCSRLSMSVSSANISHIQLTQPQTLQQALIYLTISMLLSQFHQFSVSPQSVTQPIVTVSVSNIYHHWLVS